MIYAEHAPISPPQEMEESFFTTLYLYEIFVA